MFVCREDLDPFRQGPLNAFEKRECVFEEDVESAAAAREVAAAGNRHSRRARFQTYGSPPKEGIAEGCEHRDPPSYFRIEQLPHPVLGRPLNKVIGVEAGVAHLDVLCPEYLPKRFEYPLGDDP
jgi:hypothetical protein